MTFAPSSVNATSSDDPHIRVIIVDDSLVIRGFISRALSQDPTFKIVGTAGNGLIALDILKRTPADVIILDIEMPIMDGLTSIPKLKEIDPAVQIIMASTLTQRNAEISMKAMSLGAADYLPKPSARDVALPNDFNNALREKVKALGVIAWKTSRRRSPSLKPLVIGIAGETKKYALRPMPMVKPDIIAIGSSTGGPQALFTVIKAMGSNLPQPIVITQHMPPSFTAILADHISKQSGVTCTEAKNGDLLKAGHYYVAPGDFHMTFAQRAEGTVVVLNKEPAENFCRPAVDPMLRSLADIYDKGVLAIILTGMGVDGMKGGDVVVKAGGSMIAQDETSSVVWGMPGAVANAGLCCAILPLEEIAAKVKSIALGERS